MNTDERIARRVQELMEYQKHLQTELIKCSAALGELRAILEAKEPEADDPTTPPDPIDS